MGRYILILGIIFSCWKSYGQCVENVDVFEQLISLKNSNPDKRIINNEIDYKHLVLADYNFGTTFENDSFTTDELRNSDMKFGIVDFPNSGQELKVAAGTKETFVFFEKLWNGEFYISVTENDTCSVSWYFANGIKKKEFKYYRDISLLIGDYLEYNRKGNTISKVKFEIRKINESKDSDEVNSIYEDFGIFPLWPVNLGEHHKELWISVPLEVKCTF